MTGPQSPQPGGPFPSRAAGGRPGPAQGHEAGDAVDPDAPPPGGWFGLRVLPAGWMRGLLMIVTVLATVVVALGDLASAWVVLVLPVAVAAMIAYHEVLERLVRPEDTGPAASRKPPGDPAMR
ncbi:hypothetical protein [Frankia sp. QA3]|uniref:hypothetical protein n=1 Tax=Frankia sp. QA3 TaxID=710111 RepID=UPI000269C384|nr:hypothetical protein [Frankia sp. QA3]EIV93351.1 hypothetical protein FraQA3DRAFT_3041 [Frankia sp. QA3]